jgi:hypothetical protein
MSVTNWVRIGSFVAVATALSVALSTGCVSNTAEGDPCDIALSHDECAGGPTVACVIPTNCQGPLPADGTGDPRDTGNAYCCSPTSTLAVCQPCMTTAPAPEAGATEEAGATGDAGTD